MSRRKVPESKHPPLDDPDVNAAASLSLPALLRLANSGYLDGWLDQYFDPETGARREGSGDTLAEFLVIELTETFSPGLPRPEQLAEARRVLNRAEGDIESVLQALKE